MVSSRAHSGHAFQRCYIVLTSQRLLFAMPCHRAFHWLVSSLIPLHHSPICDSYVRPATLVRICEECNFGSSGGKCIICGGQGVSVRWIQLTQASVDQHTHPDLPIFILSHRMLTIVPNVLASKRIATGVQKLSTSVQAGPISHICAKQEINSNSELSIPSARYHATKHRVLKLLSVFPLVLVPIASLQVPTRMSCPSSRTGRPP